MHENQDARLHRILDTWEKRAQVRQNVLLPETMFDRTKKDFLLEWLPFYGHPVLERQAHLEDRIRSVAWIQYNQVTIDIENEIVIPLCLLLQDELLVPEPYRALVVQAMIDEGYHVLLTAHASAVARRQRHLEDIAVPKSHFVDHMKRCQRSYGSSWQKAIIQLAAGLITEVFIGSDLATIAYCKDSSLQPFNILVTKAHTIDESVHGYIFAALARQLVPTLPSESQAFFWEILPKTILWFFDGRCESWRTLLPQIGFEDGPSMLEDCRKQPMSMLKEEHWPMIESLVESLGCTDFTERLFAATMGAAGAPEYTG